MLIAFIILAFAGAVIYGVVSGVSNIVNNQKRLKEEAEKYNLNARPASTSFVRSALPVNIECKTASVRFAVSGDRKTAYLLCDPKEPTLEVPASSITGCRIVSGGPSALSVGGLIVGEILAGEVGAAVGAFSGNGVPMEYSLVIYLNDLGRPRVVYSLLNNTTAHTQAVYADVSKFAEDVSAAVRALTAGRYR